MRQLLIALAALLLGCRARQPDAAHRSVPPLPAPTAHAPIATDAGPRDASNHGPSLDTHPRRTQRIAALRAQLVRQHVDPTSITVREDEGNGAVAVVIAGVPPGAESDLECHHHDGWLVVDEGLAPLPAAAVEIVTDNGGLTCEDETLHVAEDPHAGPSAVRTQRGVVALVGASPSGLDVVPASCEVRWNDSVCGRVARCVANGDVQAAVPREGRLVREDDCVDALNAVDSALDDASAHAVGDLALPLAPHVDMGDEPHVDLSPASCTSPDAAALARAQTRLQRAVRSEFVRYHVSLDHVSRREAESNLDALQFELAAGCVDASGAFLAYVTSDDPVDGRFPGYTAFWRLTSAGANLLMRVDGRRLAFAAADFTGDGVPDLMVHEGCWECEGDHEATLSSQWSGVGDVPHEVGRAGAAPTDAPVLIQTQDGGGVVSGDTIFRWSGTAWVRETTRFESVRRALERDRSARAAHDLASEALWSLPAGSRSADDACARDRLLVWGDALLPVFARASLTQGRAGPLLADVVGERCPRRSQWVSHFAAMAPPDAGAVDAATDAATDAAIDARVR